LAFNKKMQKKVWSPWAAGVLLGLTSIVTYVLVDTTIGSSGGIQSIDSILLKLVNSSLAETMYFKFLMPPVVSFQMLLFIGMLLGAFTSSMWSKDFKFRMMPDQQWTKVFGPSKLKRWTLIFIGGIIIQYSAGIAGGCTSGLAISGTMQLSPAGLIFIVGLFVSGIITTKILYGKEY